jgi:hypothetical protein
MRGVTPSAAPVVSSRPDRSPVPPEVANQLRDALGRRQKELPARWLAAVDTTALRAGAELAGHEHEAAERELGLALLGDTLSDARPRGTVCIRPSASGANLRLADALDVRGSVMAIAASELDATLASEMRERVASRGICGSSYAVPCDTTAGPEDFDRNDPGRVRRSAQEGRVDPHVRELPVRA